MKTTIKNGETKLSVENENGITLGELAQIVNSMLATVPDAKDIPVSLCLSEVETYTTRITAALNEGDNSVFWLRVSEETEELLLTGSLS